MDFFIPLLPVPSSLFPRQVLRLQFLRDVTLSDHTSCTLCLLSWFCEQSGGLCGLLPHRSSTWLGLSSVRLLDCCLGYLLAKAIELEDSACSVSSSRSSLASCWRRRGSMSSREIGSFLQL